MSNNDETLISRLRRQLEEKNEDLESKDKLISSLRLQISSLQDFRSQSDSLRKQTQSLEEKMNSSEVENSAFINERLKELAESEGKLRSILLTKDKTINDYSRAIKEHENNLCLLKRQLIEKETSITDFRYENSELKSKIKNISIQLEQREDELINNREGFEKRIKELTLENELITMKNSEFKSSLNNLTKSFNDLEYTNKVLEKDLSNFSSENTNLKALLDELKVNNNKQLEELETLRVIKSRFNENERQLNTQKIDLQNQIQKNSELSEELLNVSEKYRTLKLKYSGENTVENLTSKIETLENENTSLKETVDNINQINQTLNSQLKALSTELAELSEHMNQELKNICLWAETYLGTIYDETVEVPDLPITINKTIKDHFRLDELKGVLIASRKKITEEFSNQEQTGKIIKAELDHNLQNQEKLVNEIANLKANKQSEEKIKEMANKITRYESLMEKIQNLFKKSLNEDSNQPRFPPKIEEIERDVLKLVGLFEPGMESNGFMSENRYKVEYEKLKEEILKERRSNKDIITIQKREEEISKLREENEVLRERIRNKELVSLAYPNSDSKEDSKLEAKMLEKRINNLLREIELKDIQINSQEQMINRRNRELEEIRNKSGYIMTTEKSNISPQKLKAADLDKEKLLKDNMVLTNENKELKEQISNLMEDIPEVNVEKYESLLKELEQNLAISEEEIKNKDVLIRQLLSENRFLKQSAQSFNQNDTGARTEQSNKDETSPNEIKGLRSRIRKNK